MSQYRPIKKEDLTIREAQNSQPWDQQYSSNMPLTGYEYRELMGRHALLHIQKLAGKIATVYERTDHCNELPSNAEITEIEMASADLINIALRFANLYNFDLQSALESRVIDKNRRGFEKNEY